MSIYRIGMLLAFLATSAAAKVNAQQYFTGSVGTTTAISRMGSTTLGYALFRSSSNATQVLEHPREVGDFYIRSVAYQVPGDEGNLILNDIGGFVGIGTARPREKLSVNGNIRAKEIKVEATNWPDYVFRPDYPLLPIASVKQFISDHGHLPEVPTAAEVAEEGLSVGEMNTMLMKKVEELTLYIIELEERIGKLEKK